MKISDLSRKQCSAILCVGGIPLIYMALYAAQQGRGSLNQTFQYVLQISPHLFAMLCNLAYACQKQHSSASRRCGWFLLGLTGLSYVVGDLIYFYHVGVRHVDAPFPSGADAAWLLVFPLLIGGVLALFGSLPGAGRMRLLLDSAIASSSVAALSWYFLVERIWQQSGVSSSGKLVSLAYPIGDLAAIFSAIVLFHSPATNRPLRRSLVLLASGICLWAFADLVYAYSRLHGVFHDGSWTDFGWPLGSVLIGLAALIPFCRMDALDIEGSAASRSLMFMAVPRLASMFMPYVASLGAFVIISAHDYQNDHKIGNDTLLIGLFMLLLVLLRQVFTLLENRHLSRQLAALNGTLEQRVARRTEQLSALLRINSAVNDTLQVEEVLTVAGKQIQEAFGADAVIVWLSDVQENRSQKDERPLVTLLAGGQEMASNVLHYLEQAPVHTLTEALLLPVPTQTRVDSPNVLETANTASLQTIFPSTCQQAGGHCLRAPLLWRQQTLGMIGVIRWQAGFETAEADMLQNIGLEVATALENARLYSAAIEAADQDPVTGLLNHRAMHQRLDRALLQADAQQNTVVVMMLDLNNFKLFNDTYGHPVGDQVLRHVAETMRLECPSGAILGRYGGDEFIIVMPDVTMEVAITSAERMSDSLMTEGFRRANEDRVIPITLSFGLASFPEDSVNRHELLTIADKNLYAAQSSGESIGRSSAFQRANRDLSSEVSYGLLDGMVTAVDNKDRYTRQHSEDVTEYSLWIGEELEMSEETLHALRVGGLLHDVGKIGVPDEILRKPGRLTNEEYTILQRHPVLGALIVGSIPGMENIVDVVRSHHERWDGGGYPDGLRGEDIPLLGRIAAIADAVSAMTTNRPYRRGMEWEIAMNEVQAHSGTQFDPVLSAAFLRAAKKRRPALTLLSTQLASTQRMESLPKAA
jgi:diguanylate cyclase (GGDEF)-like protein